jgi:hypothetical protein
MNGVAKCFSLSRQVQIGTTYIYTVGYDQAVF